MKIIKYFFEFIFIYFLLIVFKIIGYKNASNLGEKIGISLGPLFRSKTKIINNLKNSNIGVDDLDREKIIKKMWGNYGRILAEYSFMKKFKNNIFKKYIEVEGIEYLEEIKKKNKKVVFISGHFNNFELMAMQLENSGLNVAAIYRPLNNIFLNRVMEKIRVNHICKKQLKKGAAKYIVIIYKTDKSGDTPLFILQSPHDVLLYDKDGTKINPLLITKKQANDLFINANLIPDAHEIIKDNYAAALAMEEVFEDLIAKTNNGEAKITIGELRKSIKFL